MGQQQSSRGSKRQKQLERKALRPLRQDKDYITAISNPIFLYKEEDQPDAPPRMPVQISSTLYISNSSGVIDITRLKRLGITHLLNVGGFPAAYLPGEAYTNEGIEYKLVEALDEPGYPMLDNHWNECYEFLTTITSNDEQYEKEEGKQAELSEEKQQQGQQESLSNEEKQEKKDQNCCLVHCQAGSNRSALIVAAYYMITYRVNVLETVMHCRKCRGNAFLLNPGFQRQLVALARREKLLGPAPGNKDCIVDRSLWFKNS